MLDGSFDQQHLLDHAKLPVNDIGNAERLKRLCGDDLIVIAGLGWAHWDGAKYNTHGGDLFAAKIAKRLPELVAEELVAMKALQGADSEGNLYGRYYCSHEKLIVSAGNLRTYKAALEALRPDLIVSGAALNAAPHLINTPNGTIDLKAFINQRGFPKQRKQTPEALSEWATAFFGPHQRAHYPTRAATAAYDPTAKCPMFRATLKRALPDPEIRACFQRCAGAMLYGANRSQAMLILRASGGNGKTTIIKALTAVLGDYAATCRAEVFLQGPPDSAGRATPEEIDLIGARLVEAAEPEKHAALSGARIKAFTGGDKRTGRAPYAKARSASTQRRCRS